MRRIAIKREPKAASEVTHDLIVVGGGIHGVMLAFEASKRGYRVLLLDKNDFGGATTFNSLRIVHGGLRYLQNMDVRRVLESVHERNWFLRHYPQLVKPLPCLMPLYRNGLKRVSAFRAALWINDLLAWNRNHGLVPEARLNAGRVIDELETYRLFPGVDKDALEGGAVWYDAYMPDCQRLLIEILRCSVAWGANALNYVSATDLHTTRGRVSALVAKDGLTGDEYEYPARVVINATGPWAGSLAARFDHPIEALLENRLAWNVLLDRIPISDHALAVSAKRAKSQTYFLLPYKGKIMAGTGYAAWTEGPDDPAPTPTLLERFLADLNEAVPGLELDAGDALRVFPGLLPAKRNSNTGLASSEVVHDHGEQGGPQGLFSVVGVKLTTARRVAEKVLRKAGMPNRRTRSTRCEASAYLPEAPPIWDVRAADLLKGNTNTGSMQALRQLIEQESVVHLDDLLLRRTGLWEESKDALLLVRDLCSLFNWDETRCRQEKDRVERQLVGSVYRDKAATRRAYTHPHASP